MKKILLSIALSTLAVGCSTTNKTSEQYKYTPPTPTPITTNAEVDVPYDLLLGRAQRWMDEKGFQRDDGQSATGVITSTVKDYADGLKVMDCGKGGSKVSIAAPTTKISIMVTQNGDKGIASINLKGNTSVSYVESNGVSVPAPSITPVCVSNGQLEANFISYVNH